MTKWCALAEYQQPGCVCQMCTVLGLRSGGDREFVLRDTEPPKTALRERGTPEFEEIRRRVQAELEKSMA